MPVFKSNEVLPTQPIILLIFGEAGVSKTSLASTAKNPINIDFDRGIKRSFGKCDGLVLSNGWKEVLDELNAGTFNNYDTVVIDTAKAALDDFLMVYVTEQDYKLKTNQLKMFGRIGEEFKLFTNQLRAMGKDIIIIAHSKDKEDGDLTKKVPDVTGQSSQLLIRIADQVGYMSIRNDQRIISFNPTDNVIGKNTAQLPVLKLPLTSDASWKEFCEREIIQKVKDHISSMSEAQIEALQFIAKWHETIDAVKLDDANLKALSTAISLITEEHLKKQVRAYLSAHLKKVEWKWDAPNKVFVPVNPPAQPVDDKPVVTAEDMVKEAEAQKAALNEPSTEDLFASTKTE